ncbi:lipase (class 3) domain-containing protein [Pochonia chlamydosporia 170]|uniref:sn-1-specific diacylglycerol lipase n=1 Tax=Pochonia chlamydosporia 170 TaxID=1380566 RepID=A0A179FPZ1_METCM|nr:lipase (class 3) domain-containing protein [Pochonia chlamydosporia 170]OAQ67654.1 lipase (class 3) domain-containing protein [Pochonia chlamydosporia 170]
MSSTDREQKKSRRPPTVLGSSGFGAGLSADVSGASGSNNAAAAFHQVANASKQLDRYFQSLDGEGARFAKILEQSRWREKAAACSNSSFEDCSLAEATLEQSHCQLVRLAAVSAVKVYAKEATKDLVPDEFSVFSIPANINAESLGGSVKATNIWLYIPNDSTSGSTNVIVVAIRGSVTYHDWLVNLNNGGGRPVQDPFLGVDEVGTPYSAHPGFLECAKAMKTKVFELIHQFCSNNFAAEVRSKPTLLFTGHSAGGAVAAMLYTHLLNCDPVLDDIHMSAALKTAFGAVHCITFGAPPITTKPLLPSQAGSLLLSIINDGDPVPRADKEYIDALLRLFSNDMPEEGTKYVLPPRVFFNAGAEIITLVDGRLLRPSEFGKGSLAETLMGDKRAHSMLEYRRRLEL